MCSGQTASALAIMIRMAERSEALCEAVARGAGAEARAQREEIDALRGALASAPPLTPNALSPEQLAALKDAVGRVKHAEATFAGWQEGAQPIVEKAAARAPVGPEIGMATLLDGASTPDFAAFLPGPIPVTNSIGQPLAGYDGANLARAALHLVAHGSHGRYEEGLRGLGKLEQALRVERMGLEYLSLVLPGCVWERYGQPVTEVPSGGPMEGLLLRMYAAFTGASFATIEDRLTDGLARGEALWREVVLDEANPTFEQLSTFYNGREFPEGDMMPEVLNSRLQCAYRMISILLARQIGAKRAFDYGGGVGLTTSALAASGMKHVTLIEESQVMLEFAAWRDGEAGIEGVNYLRESEVSQRIDELEGTYDLGVCTEVLEHVLDVKGTIARIARLVRPGGLLFQSASFGLYPHLSHLKPNVAYAGHEDELMDDAGFDRVALDLPIPTLANQRVYKRRP